MLDAFKFDGIKGWSALFAELILSQIIKRYDGYTVIPVPTSPATVIKRGWGHMEEIARKLSMKGVPVLLSVLKKRRGISQKKLDREQRKNNSLGLFFLTDRYAIQGKKILLIDDVFTTGSTLDACASLLLDHEPEAIRCLTLYRD